MKIKKTTTRKHLKLVLLGLLVIATAAYTAKATEEAPSTSADGAKSSAEPAKPAALEPESKVASDSQLTPRTEVAAEPEASKTESAEPKVAQNSAPTEQQSVEQAEAKRKGRAETTEPSKTSEKKEASSSEKAPPSETKAKPEPSKSSSSKGKQQQTSARPATKSKLPPNLGTVTSTGSGGPTHYLSKHDAYSAIAEKHGALSHVESTRKSDYHQKRAGSHLQSFGIQKASGGISDLLNPFKGVTDNGLARTLGASMRSIMKGKYSVPAYVASALLGAVALMAFYESPISPLPVPPLPEPPVGRFPPEMPVLSPNTQVPFRGNGQQAFGQQGGYNQRSSMLTSYNSPTSQAQQVLFPGNAQQRSQQINLAAPVQQLASNLLSVGKQQVAQRKSGPDYDQQTLSRSFFSPSSGPSPKMGASGGPQKQGSSILGFFGFGGSSSPQSSASPSENSAAANSPVNADQTSANKNQPGQQGGGPGPSSSGPGLSNSHLINKFKSYFSRASGPAASSSLGGSSSSAVLSPYDQYQRMSLVQALMKDTAFLPAFLSPTRKSSVAPGSSASSTAAAASKPVNGPVARMQVDSMSASSLPATSKQAAGLRTTSGYGLVRTADRIAHALLETFTSSIAQRSAAAQSNEASARKSGSEEANSLASATSLLSDIMSSYSAISSEQQPEQQVKSNLPEQNEQSSSRESALTPANEQSSTQSNQKTTNSDQQLIRKTRSVGYEYPIESNHELILREQMQPSKATQINNVIDFVADSYTNNRLLFNFVMNQVGLSQAVPYVEQILAAGNNDHH